jgi:hypothetical protein
MSACVFPVYVGRRSVCEPGGKLVAIFIDASFQPIPPDAFPSISGCNQSTSGCAEPSGYIGTPAGWRIDKDRGEWVLLRPDRPEMRVTARDALALAMAELEEFRPVDAAGFPASDREASFTLAG